MENVELFEKLIVENYKDGLNLIDFKKYNIYKKKGK